MILYPSNKAEAARFSPCSKSSTGSDMIFSAGSIICSRFLFNFGGHIGYSITPSERGKGYGKLQLKMGLEIAKSLGIKNCLITADVENIVSNKLYLIIETADITMVNIKVINPNIK